MVFVHFWCQMASGFPDLPVGALGLPCGPKVIPGGFQEGPREDLDPILESMEPWRSIFHQKVMFFVVLFWVGFWDHVF